MKLFKKHKKYTFKDLLIEFEDSDFRIMVWGKNRLPISECDVKCHLETSKDIFKCEVLYEGVDIDGTLIVVINYKVKVY